MAEELWEMVSHGAITIYQRTTDGRRYETLIKGKGKKFSIDSSDRESMTNMGADTFTSGLVKLIKQDGSDKVVVPEGSEALTDEELADLLKIKRGFKAKVEKLKDSEAHRIIELSRSEDVDVTESQRKVLDEVYEDRFQQGEESELYAELNQDRG